MKKKSEETRGGRGQRHFGGAVMLMGAFCVLLSGNPPASAVPLETPQVPAREAPVAAQVLEPLLPADTGPEKSPPPTREPACPREESFADAAFWETPARRACICTAARRKEPTFTQWAPRWNPCLPRQPKKQRRGRFPFWMR